MERDVLDHWRFAPIQTKLAQGVCTDFGMPKDVSTAILIDSSAKAYSHSNAILRLGLVLPVVYRILATLLLLVPVCLRDFGYNLFARHRGTIWKTVKKITGLGDTRMEPYRNRVVGLEEGAPLPEGWGFDSPNNNNNNNNNRGCACCC